MHYISSWPLHIWHIETTAYNYKTSVIGVAPENHSMALEFFSANRKTKKNIMKRYTLSIATPISANTVFLPITKRYYQFY
jgi:hypothetical protein